MRISIQEIQKKVTEIFTTTLKNQLQSLYFYGPKPERESDPQSYLILLKTIPTPLKLSKSDFLYLNRYPIQITSLTEEELKNSTDVFPMEFIEMKHTGTLLAGNDSLKSVEVEQKYLRQECEFYLRSHILKLREAALNPNLSYDAIMTSSYPAFFKIFKFLIYLKTRSFPDDANVLAALTPVIPVNTAVFETLFSKDKPAETRFTDYINELTQITRKTDRLFDVSHA